MGNPVLQTVNPASGDPGDRFTAVVKGDLLTHVVTSDFGVGIKVDPPVVVSDGEVKIKITISGSATPGKRDVVLTDSLGNNGRLAHGFEVL